MIQSSASPEDTRLSSLPVLVYTLTGDTAWNTDLVPFPSGAGPEYKVTTEVYREKWLGMKNAAMTATFTHVDTTSGERVATLEWKDTFPDKVRLRGSASMSINSWMKRGAGAMLWSRSSSTARFEDGQGRKYRWKNIALWHQMELHAEDTPTGAIAAFSRGGVDPFTKVYKHGTLALTARAQEISELCVVSFLFLEKRRRLEEREAEKQGSLARGRAQLMSQASGPFHTEI